MKELTGKTPIIPGKAKWPMLIKVVAETASTIEDHEIRGGGVLF